MDESELIITEDGSHTILFKHSNISYHSLHGAIAESTKIYIEYGLVKAFEFKNIIRIYEMGFGTGLNAYLSYIFASNNNIYIDYTCIEPYPIEEKIYSILNYPKLLNYDPEILNNLHASEFSKQLQLSEKFKFQKIKCQWEYFSTIEKYDLIYYDAFGPGHDSALWDLNSTMKLINMLNDNGILMSFCAQGQFKRNLKSAGFITEGLKGPIGKREVTRATKK